MIRCIPRGLCSWDFDLSGSGHTGSLEFDWMTETGSIRADGVRYKVRKDGLGSGHWTLLRGDDEVASAQKLSVFSRDFDVEWNGTTIRLSATFMSRSFQLGELANIMPDHAFTRRATIQERARDGDFALVCFAFWLTVLMWRRASRNN